MISNTQRADRVSPVDRVSYSLRPDFKHTEGVLGGWGVTEYLWDTEFHTHYTQISDTQRDDKSICGTYSFTHTKPMISNSQGDDRAPPDIVFHTHYAPDFKHTEG